MLYKRGNLWWCKFEYNGTTYRKSTRETDRERAKLFALKLQTKMRETVARRRVGIGPLSALRDADIERAKREGADPEISERTITITWAPLLFHFGNDADIAAVTPDELRRYVDARRAWVNQQGHYERNDNGEFKRDDQGNLVPKVKRIRGQTIVRELQALKRAFKEAKRRGWVAHVPDEDDWPKIGKDPPDPKLKGKLHSVERVREVLEQADSEIAEMCKVTALIGLRWGELQDLSWEWVEASTGAMRRTVPALCRVPAEHSKTRAERVLGVPREAYAMLKTRHEKRSTGGPLFGHRSVSQYLRRFAEKRGYDKAVTLRDLRHFFSTTGQEKTGDPRAVQEAMGHTKYQTTQLYQHSTLARTARVSVAVAKVLERPAHKGRHTRKRKSG